MDQNLVGRVQRGPSRVGRRRPLPDGSAAHGRRLLQSVL